MAAAPAGSRRGERPGGACRVQATADLPDGLRDGGAAVISWPDRGRLGVGLGVLGSGSVPVRLFCFIPAPGCRHCVGMQPTDSEAGPRAGGLFPPTMWSAIVAAGEPDAPAALVALERLARAYWRPLYVFLRQRGADHDSAADHVQGFFEHLISGEVLRRVERRESSFRSFLLVVFQNWLAHRHERADAQKRGGGKAHVPLAEFDSVVSDPALAIAGESPERIFDRRWAREVFDRSVARLDAEIARMDRAEFQAELRRRITGPQSAQPAWAEVGAAHGVAPGAVKQAAHVLRQRLATLLRSEVRAVVGTEAEVDGELRYLIELLSAPGNRA